jgi:hypothetical protein
MQCNAPGMNNAALRRVKARALLLPLAFAACATSSPPNVDLAAARAALLQAEPVAHRYAAAELRGAQEKLARAEQAMARDDWTQARRLAEEAEVDARYAWALAENERARHSE